MELVVQFPARDSTQVLLCIFLVCCGCETSYIVSVHIQCQASVYTLSLCRGHSWRVRLAKQETLTPPGHLVSPLVCRGPWMSTVVLYCWCHSDGASVLLYFTLELEKGLYFRKLFLHLFSSLLKYLFHVLKGIAHRVSRRSKIASWSNAECITHASFWSLQTSDK